MHLVSHGDKRVLNERDDRCSPWLPVAVALYVEDECMVQEQVSDESTEVMNSISLRHGDLLLR